MLYVTVDMKEDKPKPDHVKKVRSDHASDKDKNWKDWPPEVIPPEPEKVPPDLPQEVYEQSDGNEEPNDPNS